MALYLADFRRGDTFRVKIEYPAGTDITGVTHWLTLKTDFADPDIDAVLQVSAVAGSQTGDDPTNGLAYVVASVAQTAAIPPGRYFYDIQASHPSGEIVTLCPPVADYKDKLRVAPEVTEHL